METTTLCSAHADFYQNELIPCDYDVVNHIKVYDYKPDLVTHFNWLKKKAIAKLPLPGFYLVQYIFRNNVSMQVHECSRITALSLDGVDDCGNL